MGKFKLELEVETEMEEQEFVYHLKELKRLGESEMNRRLFDASPPHFDWNLKILNLDEDNGDKLK